MNCPYCDLPKSEHKPGLREPLSCVKLIRAQLSALRAAAEPFVRVAEELGGHTPDSALIEVNHQAADYRRLAEAVGRVKP